MRLEEPQGTTAGDTAATRADIRSIPEDRRPATKEGESSCRRW
jgi:hypothetical protein